MTTRYLRIRQQLIISKLEGLSSVLVALHQRNLMNGGNGGAIAVPSTGKRRMARLHAKFDTLSQQTVALYDQIQGHNRFWNPILAVYFACYILEVCYLSLGLFLSSGKSSAAGMNIQSQAYFITFGADFMLLLLWMTHECSVIVRKNGQIQRQKRRFYSLMMQLNSYKVPVVEVIKVNV